MILVTGANGFLGTILVQFLSTQNIPVLATYRTTLPSNLQNLANITWQQCDLLDVDAIENCMHGITRVYHCANMVSFNRSDAIALMHNNVEGTANLVNACLENNIQKFIFVSSVGAIAREGEGKLISEKTPWLQNKTTSMYALSKYKAEMEVWRAGAEGLPIAIVCPSVILGEGDYSKGSAALFTTVYNKFPFYTSGINGFVDVQDVVQSMVLLMQSNITNERFIINAANCTYLEIFSNIAVSLNVKTPKIKAGPFLSGLAWRLYAIIKIFTGKENILTKETSQTAQSIYKYDNSKFLNAFPDFKYKSLQESVIRIAKHFLSNKP
jgi:dihydroflavonol-4-reductase